MQDRGETLGAMEIARDPTELARRLGALRRAGAGIGFVPTMGALHEGHLSLVDIAVARADFTVASIFVNPRQFAPGEDFGAYPRTEETDCAMLEKAGCDLVFLPAARDLYRSDFATTLTMGGPAEGLESLARPHFFGGVALVVLKLFNRIQPDFAVFGEKDYQQLLVVRALVKDLDLPIDILAGPTLRAADGLALSSRNAFLPAGDRSRAPGLHAALLHAAEMIADGATPDEAENSARDRILSAGFQAPDYVAVRRAEDLSAFGAKGIDAPARILAAARLGGVRLIDNIAAAAPGLPSARRPK